MGSGFRSLQFRGFRVLRAMWRPFIETNWAEFIQHSVIRSTFDSRKCGIRARTVIPIRVPHPIWAAEAIIYKSAISLLQKKHKHAMFNRNGVVLLGLYMLAHPVYWQPDTVQPVYCSLSLGFWPKDQSITWRGLQFKRKSGLPMENVSLHWSSCPWQDGCGIDGCGIEEVIEHS